MGSADRRKSWQDLNRANLLGWGGYNTLAQKLFLLEKLAANAS